MFGRTTSAPLFFQPEGLVDLQPLQKQHIPFLSVSKEASPVRTSALAPPQRMGTIRSNRTPDQSPDRKYDDRESAKWAKAIQQLQYNPPIPTYYDSLPIKPGFFFLESLISAPYANLSSLHVNLPATLYYSDELCMLYTGNLQVAADGTVVCDREAHFITFLKRLEQFKAQTIATPFDQVAAVLRLRTEKEADMKKYVFDWTLFRQKMLAHDMKLGTMLQEFIKSPGGKPAIVRLTYYASTKVPRANFAYLISSRVHSDPQSSLLQKTVTDSSRPFWVEIFKQTGLSLKPFEAQARSVVDYLQRGYRARIEEIVLDFIKNEQGVVYLCGCKGFRLDQATVPVSVGRGASPLNSGRSSPVADSTSKSRMSFVTCRLCRLQFTNQELPHLISVKLLFLFRSHAMKRVKLPIETSHLKVTSTDFLSQSVRICACCFLVVTAELALVKAERELALALSIPVKDEDITALKVLSPQNQFLPKSLRQQRLLFHFKSLEVGRTRYMHSALFLHFEFYMARATFALERIEDTQEAQYYPINSMRLVYVFSSDSKPMQRFLQDSIAKLTITNDRSPGQGQVFAHGASHLLQSFPADLEFSRALYSKHCFSLFDPTGKMRFPLEMGVGFAADHHLDTSLLQVSLTKVMDAYLPEDHYFNTDPLPGDWISVFGIEEKEDSFGEDVDPEDAYGPLIDRGDLDRMQDITSPYPAPLSNKLVVSRAKPRRSQSVALIQNKGNGETARSIALASDELDRNTDAQVQEVMSLVDHFLRPKSIPSIPRPVDSLNHSRAASTQRNQPTESTKRTTSRKRSSRVSSRVPSGKSSTRCGTPVPDVKETLRHYKKIIITADNDLRL